MKLKVSLRVLVAAGIIAAAGCGGDQPKQEKQAVVEAERFAFPKQAIHFGQGFYGEESFKDGTGTIHLFRWMQAEGHAELPPSKSGAILKFALHIPGELMKPPPRVTIALNGQAIDSFEATKDVYDRAYPIAATDLHADTANNLVFKTTKTSTPSDKDPKADPRTFGLQITDLRLEPINP